MIIYRLFQDEIEEPPADYEVLEAYEEEEEEEEREGLKRSHAEEELALDEEKAEETAEETTEEEASSPAQEGHKRISEEQVSFLFSSREKSLEVSNSVVIDDVSSIHDKNIKKIVRLIMRITTRIILCCHHSLAFTFTRNK